MIPAWRPRAGAWPVPDGIRFRVWAPGRRTVHLLLEREGRPLGELELDPEPDGWFHAVSPGARPGDRYRYRLDDDGPFPDPASRFQPEGVHGPSQIVDPATFPWTDHSWTAPDPRTLVIYEIHLGSFTSEGTFHAAATRLAELRELGITAIELMPVADFPGRWNWGYDGAALFAPARCYGSPDDLRRLVDSAHALGLAVLLDVVYNHLGPDGAYLAAFAPPILSPEARTPWGAAVNLDGPGSATVRELLTDNAIHWLTEYHLDGLRLDATHALVDHSARHLMAELAAEVRRAVPRTVFLMAEDHRNLALIARPETEGGWGFDATWSDDFHHQIRRALAGDRDGYFIDFGGTAEEIARTLQRGWFYDGRHSVYFEGLRGSDPSGLPPTAFVIFLQNHDQIGNRARGERLHHQIDAAAWRAATTLLLLAPETPLLFMGQEWAASTPFLYFTDHEPVLGRRVTQGRRNEFRRFAGFADAAARATIPDPQAETTFRASRLDWTERSREPHAGLLRLTAALLRLRHQRVERLRDQWDGIRIEAVGEDALRLDYHDRPDRMTVVVRLRGRGPVRLAGIRLAAGGPGSVLDTEDVLFAADPAPPRLHTDGTRVVVEFARPGAVVLSGFDASQ